MSDLLAYWRFDNYRRDLDEGAGFNFNSNQRRLHSVLEEGDSLWLFTGQHEVGRVGKAFYLVARLVIRTKTLNHPSFKYGSYRVWGDLTQSRYFAIGAKEVSGTIRHLPLLGGKMIGDTTASLAQHFQTMREVSPEGSEVLERWAADLPLEEKAYRILPEELLEEAIRQGSDAVRKLIRETPVGIAENRVEYLVQQPVRSRSLVRQIHGMYGGRCQICGFDPRLLYQVDVCHAHHLIYLSRGGEDRLENLALLCPNHHAVIHATNAVFDYADLSFVLAPNQRERLALNHHL